MAPGQEGTHRCPLDGKGHSGGIRTGGDTPVAPGWKGTHRWHRDGRGHSGDTGTGGNTAVASGPEGTPRGPSPGAPVPRAPVRSGSGRIPAEPPPPRRECGRTKGAVSRPPRPRPPPRPWPHSMSPLSAGCPVPPVPPPARRPLARGSGSAGIARCCRLLNLGPRPPAPSGPSLSPPCGSEPAGDSSHHVAGCRGQRVPPPPHRAARGAG